MGYLKNFITIVLLVLLVATLNSQHRPQPSYFYNYVGYNQPIELKITIFNSTETVFRKTYAIVYNLENQPQLEDSIDIPVHIQMENYTIKAELFKENQDVAIQTSIKNFTRRSKVRKEADFTTSIQMEGVSNKVDQNTKYDLHLPKKFVVMPIYMNQFISRSMRQMVNMYNFRAFTSGDMKHYVPPIDLSQLHIPFKSYTCLTKFITKQAQYKILQNMSLENLTQNYQDQQFNRNNSKLLDELKKQQYHYNFTLVIRLYPFHYFQIFYGFTDLQLMKKAAPIQIAEDIYTEEMIDMMKQLFFENNFYFLVAYTVLSCIQVFMQIFAFKNEIHIWKQIQKKGGLSIKSLYQWLGCYIIMLLYLIDQEANILYIVFIVLDIILTIWKITKAIKVELKSSFPFMSLGYKQWYHKKTESADREATHYTSYLITILFSLFMLYKLYPVFKQVLFVLLSETGNGLADIQIPKFSIAYSFMLESFMGFIFVFGFVMITPQLYINYKLKSVDHLPWKTLIYRFISTIIDDIFVFMIDLPWLQRAFSFRDDIVFIIYLFQRRIYRVDKNRLALSGGSVDLTKNKIEDPTTDKKQE